MNIRDMRTVEQLAALTGDERREMLMTKEEGQLPTVINRSPDLYFRFLLAYPVRIELLKVHRHLVAVRGKVKANPNYRLTDEECFPIRCGSVQSPAGVNRPRRRPVTAGTADASKR